MRSHAFKLAVLGTLLAMASPAAAEINTKSCPSRLHYAEGAWIAGFFDMFGFRFGTWVSTVCVR